MQPKMESGEIRLGHAEQLLLRGNLVPPPQYRNPPLLKDTMNPLVWSEDAVQITEYYKSENANNLFIMKGLYNQLEGEGTFNCVIAYLGNGGGDWTEQNLANTHRKIEAGWDAATPME